MHIPIPDEWRLASQLQFDQILSDLNWKKDSFGFYVIVGTKTRFAIKNGTEILVDPLYLPDDD